MANFLPSQYQKNIFNWIESGSGDGFVQAVAGSGKTTTLVEGAKKLKDSKALFLAFNKTIADNLGQDLPQNMEARTFHSLGKSCLFQMLGATQPPDKYKYRNLANKEAKEIFKKIKYGDRNSWGKASLNLQENTIAKQLNDLVHFAMVTLTEPSDRNATLNMIRHFGIDIDFEQSILFDELLSAATRIIASGEELARNAKIIDFNDMVYLPIQWHLRVPKYDWIFVDEAQDLSKVQLELALRARGQGGRILFVGDKHQAIYGFAGANCDSVDEIIKETRAKELPLSICYRCPTSHLNLAREIVPHIEPRPDAPEGNIEAIKLDKVSERVQSGDLILSRTTAPLVELCIKLISKNIPARVRGRDIGTSITSIAQEISQISGFTYYKLPTYLKDWEQQKLEKLQSNPDNEGKIQSLRDRCQSIIACYEGFNCFSIEELCTRLERLFSDEQPGVMLSTIHRAKGLQNRRVMILDYDKLPLKWLGQKSHELEQEWNLKYVALTRAEEALFLVQASQKLEENSNRNNSLPNRNQEQPKNVPQPEFEPKNKIVLTSAGKRQTPPTIKPILENLPVFGNREVEILTDGFDANISILNQNIEELRQQVSSLEFQLEDKKNEIQTLEERLNDVQQSKNIDYSPETSDIDPWNILAEKYSNNEILDVQVTRINTGGALVRLFNIQGFIPRSHLVQPHNQSLVGKWLKVVVLELKPENKNLCLSEKEAAFYMLKIGQLAEGKIVGIRNYGVLVKFNGLQGLLYISEITDKIDKIDNIDKFFNMDQKIKAVIIKLDNTPNGMKIDLSTKVLEEYSGEMLEHMDEVMSEAEARLPEAWQKLSL